VPLYLRTQRRYTNALLLSSIFNTWLVLCTQADNTIQKLVVPQTSMPSLWSGKESTSGFTASRKLPSIGFLSLVETGVPLVLSLCQSQHKYSHRISESQRRMHVKAQMADVFHCFEEVVLRHLLYASCNNTTFETFLCGNFKTFSILK